MSSTALRRFQARRASLPRRRFLRAEDALDQADRILGCLHSPAVSTADVQLSYPFPAPGSAGRNGQGRLPPCNPRRPNLRLVASLIGRQSGVHVDVAQLSDEKLADI